MSYIFTKDKKKVVAFGGIFDPCEDQTQMGNNWILINAEGTPPDGPLWDIVSSPGGAGNYSHRIHGEASAGALTGGWGFISPFTGDIDDRNGSFPVYSPYKWKYKAEFRTYIVDDFDSGEVDSTLFGGTGFMVDGCYVDPTFFITNLWRIMVMFNVTNQKVGLCGAGWKGGAPNFQDLYSFAWSGSYNTWYKIRVYWEYDFFIDPTIVTVSCYSSDTLLFSQDVPIEEWKLYPDDTNETEWWNNMYQRAFQGRCGFGAFFFRFSAGAGQVIDAYFKDILITLDNPRLLSYTYSDSILHRNAMIEMKGMFISSNNYEVNKGTDIQLWRRNSINDAWSGRWRGTIREVNVLRKNIIIFEAEGLGIEFMSEKAENLTLTTKTTAEIVIAALNNPDKKFINTTAYFDSVSNTYNRYYPTTVKIDILMEAAALEGFIEYFDMGNNFHFQSVRSNYSELHLKWGEDRIYQYKTKNITIRKPNRIRVNGSGVYAERRIVEEMHTVGSEIVREINRPDLTVQGDVEDVVNYYSSLYRRPIAIQWIKMIENFSLYKGKIITLTLDPLGIFARRFLILDIKSTSTKICEINLLEVTPEVVLYLAELGSRQKDTESEGVALDTITDSPQHTFEGVAGLLVSAEYEIEFSSTVEQSGKMVVTDDFIDDLLNVLNGTTVDDPTAIAVGTDSTPSQYTDSALGSESSRAAATATRTGIIMDFDSYKSGHPNYYHKIKFERIITDPSSLNEIGLLNNNVSGGTLACRVGFADYSKTGDVTFRVILTLLPVPSSTYISFYGVDKIINWLYDGSWTDLTRMYHLFSYGFCPPSPFTSKMLAMNYVAAIYDCYVPTTLATLTTSVLNDLDQIVFQYFIASFNSADGCGAVIYPSNSFVLTNKSPAGCLLLHSEFFACAYFHNTRIPSSYDNSVCTWRMIIEIKRGEFIH